MQVELKDIPREDLELFIYEEFKTAYGVKGRHYNFAAMSRDELEREAESIADACDRALEEEARREKESIVELELEIESTIKCGAGDRETALRWMTSEERFYHNQCVEHWVWNQGVLFTDYGRKLVNELMDIVKFAEEAA